MQIPRTWLTSVVCVLLASALPARLRADALPDTAGLELRPDQTGVCTLDGIRLMVVHKSESWVPAYQRDLVPARDETAGAPGVRAVKGTLKTDAGAYTYAQEIRRIDPNTVIWKATLQGTPTKPTAQLSLTLDLPVGTYRGQHLLVDDQACDLPWWFAREQLFAAKSGTHPRCVRIPLQHGGTLVIEGDLRPSVQALRAYNTETYVLHLPFSPGTGLVESASLELTLRRVETGAPLAVAYNPATHKPERSTPLQPPERFTPPDGATLASRRAQVKPLPRLTPRGEDFCDPEGRPIRFWGANLAAFYPDAVLAERTAANLASLGVNLVRPHHVLRPSRDWCPADCCSLARDIVDSRTPCLKAWDRFDDFNARLRAQGIYLAITLHGTRMFYPDDVSILRTNAVDDEAWADAMDELNRWPWQKGFDPRKMLPVFDERSFQLNAEFAQQFLTHVNPYTGLRYADDPQVATVELVNEFSSAYTLICGNVFPEYWTRALNARLRAFLSARGAAPFDIRQARTPEQRRLLVSFCDELDAAYATRMRQVVHATGCTAAIEFSNLWRGDNDLHLRASSDDVIEDHAYDDPLAVAPTNRLAYGLVKSALAGKPLLIGEFNETENPALRTQRLPERSMTVPGIVAYASLQNAAGIVWFAWAHGTLGLNSNGWSRTPPTAGTPKVGQADDRIFLDHARTASIIYRNRDLQSSLKPQIVVADSTAVPASYEEMMSGTTTIQPGWQAVCGFRKVFRPGGQPFTECPPWFLEPPSNPAISDTGEIVTDAHRRQLTFAAPKAEGLSGYLDGKPMANLTVLDVQGDAGFATVMLVTLDDTPLASSHKILLSKTFTDATGRDTSLCTMSLKGLAHGAWRMTVTRPIPGAAVTVAPDAAGTLKLPDTDWNACELECRGKP